MTWELTNSVAVGRTGDLVVQVDFGKPVLGLDQLDWQGQRLKGVWQSVKGNLLSNAPTIEECYVRGCDVVCRYQEDPISQLTTTVYWSLNSDPATGIHCLDLRLAVQTSTLGSQPQVDVEWHFPHGVLTEFGLSETLIDELLAQSDQPLSFIDRQQAEHFRMSRVRLPEPAASVVPLVHLSDYRDQTFVSEKESTQIQQQLAIELLEKGVIRTARLRLLVGSDDLADAQLMDEAIRFFESELPLTT